MKNAYNLWDIITKTEYKESESTNELPSKKLVLKRIKGKITKIIKNWERRK